MLRRFVLAGLTAAALLAQEPSPAVAPGRGPGGRGRGPGRNGLGGMGAGFVLNPSLDKIPPQLPADLKPGGVLIYSKTTGFRDESAIQASNAVLATLAHTHGWPFFVTENGAVMNPEQLSKFKLVVWSNTAGDTLDDSQKAAFRTWVENGGSYFGIHGAGGDPRENHGHTSLADWKWYVDTLVGAQFVVHSGIVPGDIHVEDRKNPIMKGLPEIWHRAEEWYAFEKSPRDKPGFHILATVDEKSYDPGRATMGDDHPLIWWHCVGKGHAAYSALGHGGFMYSEALIIQLIENAMTWGLSESGKGCAAGK